MITVSPLEVILSEDEFLSGNFQQFPITSVLGNDGVCYRLFRLTCGRQCLVKTGELGIPTSAQPSKVHEVIEMLPGGVKIPRRLLDDVLVFFRRVMSLHGDRSEYEAMAHIVWNTKKKKYRVAIPKQRVSKASVSYDNDHMVDGDVIVLDIHSHNTMSAFFSGTDDSDDRGYFGISGVAGKLNTEGTFVWRINLGSIKRSIGIEQIFETDETEVKGIEEWLKQVEAPTRNAWGAWPSDDKGPTPRRETQVFPVEEEEEPATLEDHAIEEIVTIARDVLDEEGVCQAIIDLADMVSQDCLDAYSISIN